MNRNVKNNSPQSLKKEDKSSIKRYFEIYLFEYFKAL